MIQFKIGGQIYRNDKQQDSLLSARHFTIGLFKKYRNCISILLKSVTFLNKVWFEISFLIVFIWNFRYFCYIPHVRRIIAFVLLIKPWE
jgi:hypothetical protein